jgi:hypothetical protein
MCREVLSLYGSDEKSIVSNRRFMPQSIRFPLILASLECFTVGQPRRKFVCLYGQPGRKHRIGSWTESNKTRKTGRLVQRQSECPIMRPCFMGGLGHTFKCLGRNTDLVTWDDCRGLIRTQRSLSTEIREHGDGRDTRGVPGSC